MARRKKANCQRERLKLVTPSVAVYERTERPALVRSPALVRPVRSTATVWCKTNVLENLQ